MPEHELSLFINHPALSVHTWTLLSVAGILKAHAFVAMITLRAGTQVASLGAPTGHPLVAGVGVAQVHHDLEKEWEGKVRWWESDREEVGERETGSGSG